VKGNQVKNLFGLMPSTAARSTHPTEKTAHPGADQQIQHIAAQEAA
jgi:hypothetical protein